MSQSFSIPSSPKQAVADISLNHSTTNGTVLAESVTHQHILSRHSVVGQMNGALELHKGVDSPSLAGVDVPQLETRLQSHSSSNSGTHPLLPALGPDDAPTELIDHTLTDMLGLHDLLDFGFAPLDADPSFS
jgi:hypothetical protein